jgi:glycosyltransferase involved in cell wall biosynthesis
MSRKVLIIIDSLGLSGKTVSVVNLALGLDPALCQVELAVFKDDEGSLQQQIIAAGIPLHRINCEDGLSLAAIVRLWQLMRRIKPDVVHCYNPRPILYGALAARIAGCQRIIGSLSAMASQVPDRDYEFLPQRLSTLTWKNRLRNRLSARLLNYLCVVSPSLGERFCRYNGIATDCLRIVPYGVAIPAIEESIKQTALALRRKFAYDDSDIIVASIGRLIAQKDYAFQLQAFAVAAKQNPQLKMLIVGGGLLYETIKKLIDELELQGRVLMIGHRDDVPVMYRMLDIFVLTSRFEPYGVGLLEAKAHACPIVATAVNEIPEIIQHNVNGMLVESGDVATLANTVLELAANPEKRQQLASAARADAINRHSLAVMIASYQKLYCGDNL